MESFKWRKTPLKPRESNSKSDNFYRKGIPFLRKGLKGCFEDQVNQELIQ